MKVKPEWWKSRTFWAGVVSGVVTILNGAGASPDVIAAIQQYAPYILSVLLVGLGFTERASKVEAMLAHAKKG